MSGSQVSSLDLAGVEEVVPVQVTQDRDEGNGSSCSESISGEDRNDRNMGDRGDRRRTRERQTVVSFVEEGMDRPECGDQNCSSWRGLLRVIEVSFAHAGYSSGDAFRSKVLRE